MVMISFAHIHYESRDAVKSELAYKTYDLWTHHRKSTSSIVHIVKSLNHEGRRENI